MVTYLLNGGEQVGLPTRPLVVRLQAGNPTGEHRLVASVPEGQPLAVVRQGMIVLPRINQATTVRLFPALGLELFPPQSLLTVVVGPDGADPDADYLSLAVDVSGLPQRELVLIEPAGSTLQVTALGRRLDLELSPHAEAARDMARELLGVPFVPSTQAVDIRIGVDTSPSMRAYATDGTLQAVLETMAGVASVIDPDGELEAVLCGRVATRLAAVPVDRFGAVTTAAAVAQPLVTGCRSVTVDTDRPDTITYLVSDGVPADLFRRHDDPPHLVVVGDAAFAAAGTLTRVPAATVIPADVGPDHEGLRWEPAQLRSVVASMLTSYHARQVEPA